MDEMKKVLLQLIEGYETGKNTAEDVFHSIENLVRETESEKGDLRNPSFCEEKLTSYQLLNQFIGSFKTILEQEVGDNKNESRNVYTISQEIDITKVIDDFPVSRLGEKVILGNEINEMYANTIVSICRRRLKKQDLILVDILDEGEEAEAGVAFTKAAIYCWEENDEFNFEVYYSEIENVDFDEDSVYITKKNGQKESVFCGEEGNEYSRYMYNFIMDIKDLYDSHNSSIPNSKSEKDS